MYSKHDSPRRFRFVSGSGYTATLAWDPPLEPGPNPIVGYEISWAQYIYPEQPLMCVRAYVRLVLFAACVHLELNAGAMWTHPVHHPGNHTLLQ